MITNARRTNPQSSHIAGAIIEASGKAATNRAKVLELVKSYPNLTSKELSSKTSDLDRHEIARRLPELRDKGLITVTGFGERKQLKWSAV